MRRNEIQYGEWKYGKLWFSVQDGDKMVIIGTSDGTWITKGYPPVTFKDGKIIE